jgi:recombination protein RecR
VALIAGCYHGIGGVILPIDKISSGQLRIKESIKKVTMEEIKEVIFTTNLDLKGEARVAYLVLVLELPGDLVARLASGLPAGGEQDYADEVTLGRA